MRGGLVLAAALAFAGGAGAAAPTDEGTARRIVGTGSSAMPAWMPDGSRIVFHARRKDDQQKGFATRNVWSVGADGSGEKKLTGGTKDEYHASLSPDGKKLLFVSELNGSRDIWLADADGQNPVPLTDDPGTATQPAWSPDGRTLAFQHHVATGWEIWSLALPADLARTGHLRLAQQVRGGADVDTAKLRGGDTVRGTVEETSFRVRAAYGALVLPRAAVASILFGTGERGLARVVLANGDTV